MCAAVNKSARMPEWIVYSLAGQDSRIVSHVAAVNKSARMPE